jgi:hypothetical protein
MEKMLALWLPMVIQKTFILMHTAAFTPCKNKPDGGWRKSFSECWGHFFLLFFSKKEDYAIERLLSCCFGAMEIVFKIKRWQL